MAGEKVHAGDGEFGAIHRAGRAAPQDSRGICLCCDAKPDKNQFLADSKNAVVAPITGPPNLEAEREWWPEIPFFLSQIQGSSGSALPGVWSGVLRRDHAYDMKQTSR